MSVTGVGLLSGSGMLTSITSIAPRRSDFPALTPLMRTRPSPASSAQRERDRPVGVAAHTGPGWEGPTVLGNLEAAGYRITSYGPPERQGIVHRLDVGTSGAMMVAKSELAYTVMKRAFKERTIENVYHAVVHGHIDRARGRI